MTRKWLVRGAAAGAVLVLGALLVAWSGVIPIAASSGHWHVTVWFLELGKRSSVALYARRVDLPPLDDPALVLQGAGHYDGGCAPCHGSPAQPRSGVAVAMLPAPPDLVERVATWDAEELFYIVKHGIRFTGMPPWPAQQRDDEVRAVVAFLLALPELDAEAYLELVNGALLPRRSGAEFLGARGAGRSAPELAAACERCHGAAGEGRGLAAFPKLAGQRREYLRLALDAYATAARHSGTMGPIAAGLTASERALLADYYSALPAALVDIDAAADDGDAVRPAVDVELARAGSGGAAATASQAVARGRSIAELGIPGADVPSCADCHGPAAEERNAAYPHIAGQYAQYLELQLELFREERRGGSSYAHLMRHATRGLDTQALRDVAAYYASFGSGDP